MGAIKWLLFSIIASLVLSACGPVSFTQTRTEYKPYSESEGRQEKERVIAELRHTQRLPPTFIATVQACDQYGRLRINSSGHPVMEEVAFRRPGQYWQLMALTNNTEHVLRMNAVAIRLFDPAANQLEPLSMEDLDARLYGERRCQSTQQALQQFRANKLFSRNLEIVPGTTATFWVAFQPPSLGMEGVWKFAIYDVPVKVDEAGRPLRTTRFEMRMVAKQFVDTYTRESPLVPPKLVETREVTPATQAQAQGQTARPPVDPPPAASVPVAQSSASRQPAASAEGPPTKETIARAQVRLKAEGFDPGPADGGIGAKTRSALRRFQTARGLQASGELSAETLEALKVR